MSGCNQGTEDPQDPILASVGNETLTLGTALASIPHSVLAQDTLSAIQTFQDNWIDQKLLQREAERIGLDNNRQIQRQLERIRASLLREALHDLILEEHKEELEVSVEEAQNYYQANRDRFVLEERYVRFRHLTARTRVDADNARRDIMRGIEWADVAERYSVSPELQIRQSERFLPVSMAIPDNPRLERYLDLIGISEISPIESHNGQFHFIQLMEERPQGDHPDLDWLIEQIQQWLYLEKAQRLINTYKRNMYLQAEANNEIDKRNVEELNESEIFNVVEEQEIY